MKAQLPLKTIILVLSIMLSACSSGSSSSSSNNDFGNSAGSSSGTDASSSSNDEVADLTLGTAVIFGRVTDALSGVSLPDVQVSVDGLPETALTDSGGTYQLGSLPNDMAVTVRFSLDGYVSEVYRTPILDPNLDDAFKELERVLLVPDSNMGAGGAVGTITNLRGDLISGAVVRLIAGINAIEGIAAATTVTDAQGVWTIAGLAAGNYTCIIEVEGREPVVENVLIVGGVESANANIVLPAPTLPPIDFPPRGNRDDYGAGEVEWSYDTYTYAASSGNYSVDQDLRIGSLQLLDFFRFEVNPLNWRDSNFNIVHTFAGPGVYSIVGSGKEVEAAAESHPPAAVAYARIIASGPKGRVGADRLFSYTTIYEPPSAGGTSVTVTVGADGRYVFNISGLTLIKSAEQLREEDVHPDAQDSITLNLSNGNAP